MIWAAAGDCVPRASATVFSADGALRFRESVTVVQNDLARLATEKVSDGQASWIVNVAVPVDPRDATWGFTAATSRLEFPVLARSSELGKAIVRNTIVAPEPVRRSEIRAFGPNPDAVERLHFLPQYGFANWHGRPILFDGCRHERTFGI